MVPIMSRVERIACRAVVFPSGTAARSGKARSRVGERGEPAAAGTLAMQDGQLVAERNDLKLQFPRGCESDNQAMKEALKRMRVPLTLTGATPGSSDSFGCQLF